MRARIALVVGVVIGGLLPGGIASAYWSNNSTGSGDGSASVSAGNNKPLTIVLTSRTSGLEPGNSVKIGGVFNNPNDGYDGGRVLVHTVTVTITGVDGAGCDVADFSLSKPTSVVNAIIPAGAGVGKWGGDIALTMKCDPHKDQGACHGATVRLHMVSD